MEDSKFFIKGGCEEFDNRQRNIFDILSTLEKANNDNKKNPLLPHEHEDNMRRNEHQEDIEVRRLSPKKQRIQTKLFRGKESIYKEPEGDGLFKEPQHLPPRFKNRGIPDFQRNPDKWTKYSLGDVSLDDMSDSTNTATAFAFLKELKDRKIKDKVNTDVVGNTSKRKFTFNQPSVSAQKESEKSSFASTKLIMPEYVVGMSQKKIKRPQQTSKNAETSDAKEIKLDHLMYEDDSE